jgi:hypothetical protein
VTRRTAAGIVVVATVVLSLVVAVLVVLLELDASFRSLESPAQLAGDLVTVFSFALVGAFVTARRPDNLVGWSLSLAGLGLLLEAVCSGYADLALRAKPEAGLPAGAAAGAIAGSAWTWLMGGVFLLLVLFPTGRLPSRRWAPAVKLVLGGFALTWVVISTHGGRLDPPYEAYENPLAVTSSSTSIVLTLPVIGYCLLGVAAAAVNLLIRFRRSRGVERQQFKWLAASAALLLITLPVATLNDYSAAPGFALSVALTALPASVGVAVLRYRLYDIDRIIRRTLVYAVLTAGLAGIYFGAIVALQQLFSSVAGGSDLAVAGSTLAVAAIFRPARSRIQMGVDRRFSRRTYDAEQTVASFAARLRQEVDLDALCGDLVAAVTETIEPTHVSVWLRDGS